MVETGIFQLSQEIQPLMGIFGNRISVGFPLEFLRDRGSQKLHSHHSLVQYGKGEQCWGFPQKSSVCSIILTVFSSKVLGLFQRTSFSSCQMRQMTVVLSAHFRTLTERSLKVQSLMDPNGQNSVMSFRRANTSLSKTSS